jgi:hypothetical protein
VEKFRSWFLTLTLSKLNWAFVEHFEILQVYYGVDPDICREVQPYAARAYPPGDAEGTDVL